MPRYATATVEDFMELIECRAVARIARLAGRRKRRQPSRHARAACELCFGEKVKVSGSANRPRPRRQREAQPRHRRRSGESLSRRDSGYHFNLSG